MRPFILSPFASAMKIPGPIAFSFSGYEVYWSGILLAAGIILAILLAQYEVRRKKLPPDTAVDLCLIGIPLGVLGARLFYVFTNFALFKDDLVRILYFWDGGLSVYGALIGALIGIVIYALAKKLRFFMLTDLLAPGLLLAQAFALWSDFFEQTGFGPEITSPGLEWFPFAVLIEETDTIHAAVFFYEFVWCVLVFAALWLLVRKRAKRDGCVTLWYLLLYSGGHIALSFLRQSDSALFHSTLASRLIYAAFIVLALALLIIRATRPMPQPEPDETESGDTDTDDDSTEPDANASVAADEPETFEEPEQKTTETEQPEEEPAENDGESSGKEA